MTLPVLYHIYNSEKHTIVVFFTKAFLGSCIKLIDKGNYKQLHQAEKKNSLFFPSSTLYKKEKSENLLNPLLVQSLAQLWINYNAHVYVLTGAVLKSFLSQLLKMLDDIKSCSFSFL